MTRAAAEEDARQQRARTKRNTELLHLWGGGRSSKRMLIQNNEKHDKRDEKEMFSSFYCDSRWFLRKRILMPQQEFGGT